MEECDLSIPEYIWEELVDLRNEIQEAIDQEWKNATEAEDVALREDHIAKVKGLEKALRIVERRMNEIRKGIDERANTLNAALNAAAVSVVADEEKRFQEGMKKAGTEEWKRKVTSVGVDRFGEVKNGTAVL